MQLAANARHRRDIHQILVTALDAADAGQAVERVLSRDGDTLLLGGEPLPRGRGGRFLVAGAGKAAAVMAGAVVRVAGPMLAKGLVVAGTAPTERIPDVDVLLGAHPLPGESSLAAAAAMLALVRDAGPEDVVLFLLSGGASAMLEQPINGVSLDDLREVTRALLASGASIGELNEVRKALSAVKAGGIARAAAPAFTQTLAVSDVVGDSPAVIGSAPTVPGTCHADRAAAILRTCDLPLRLAASLDDALARTRDEASARTAVRTGYRVVASVADALAGAARAARATGYEPEIVSSAVVGEAREAGAVWARAARAAAASGGTGGGRPRCLLAGGETTVRVVGKGVGGRNQEFALAAGIELAGQDEVTVAAVGTDGRDGPTDAAGAIADGHTVDRGLRLGNEAAGFLADNDSYTFFAALDDLVTTGPTRTNVMDLHIALVGHPNG